MYIYMYLLFISIENLFFPLKCLESEWTTEQFALVLVLQYSVDFFIDKTYEY